MVLIAAPMENLVKMQKEREGPDKNPFEGMESLYVSAFKDEWESVIQHFEKNRGQLLTPMTLDLDCVLHIAASLCLRGKKELERLLQTLPTDEEKRKAMTMCNCHGNSVLHEVTVSGNQEAAEFLLDGYFCPGDQRTEHCRLLLRMWNNLGETPVYRASSFGKTNLVRLFCSRLEMDNFHFYRTVDNMSILHIAVISQRFETALYLLTINDNLGQGTEDKGLTSLQLLAQMPLAFEPNYHKNKWIETLIYNCLPDEDDQVPPHKKNDEESSTGGNQPPQSWGWKRLWVLVVQKYVSLWISLAKEWRTFKKIWNEKKNKKSLRKLIHSLVKKDFSWKKSQQLEKKEQDHQDVTTVDLGIVNDAMYAVEKLKMSSQSSNDVTAEENKGTTPSQPKSEEEEKRLAIDKSKRFTPLLLASTRGAVQIVKEILEVHPQAVEHINENGHNILHLAIRHRQYDIFKFLTNRTGILSRLTRRFDAEGNTILHQAADIRYHNTADQRLKGPALQLQDELHWFERVREIIPPHYILHHNKRNDTAEDLFNKEHEKLLKSAQVWIKDTAQACTVVGVLVATLVFAAAYTVPGGIDPDTGLPIFRNSPFFWIFTIMDISSLVSSLASVVMFLSILSAPLEYPDFRHSLPRKLKYGFALLFLSLIFTMLAFSATIFLLVRDLQKKWTRTLIYAIALVPVTVLGLMQFNLQSALRDSMKSIYKKIIRIFAPSVLGQCKLSIGKRQASQA